MAENCKIISVTANNPVVTIPNGAKVATAETKEIITNVPVTPLVTNVSDNCVKSNLSGLGEEWIPDSRLFKYNIEEFSLSDYLVTHVFKVIIDDPNMSEVISKHAAKIINDSSVITDVFDRVWNAIRSYNDTTTNTELLKFSVSKVLSETKIFQELLRFSTRKVLSDSVAMADLTKILILVSSGKFEQVNFSDVLSRVVQYRRVFVDQVDATDDFYGVMNVDDDQYALVQKIVLEWLTPVERFSVRLSKAPILETVNKSDTAYKHPQKVLSSSSTTEDTDPLFTINLGKQETVAAFEYFAKVITKPDVVDNTTVIEYIAKSFSTSFEEIVTAIDDIDIRREKVAEDLTAFLEEINLFVQPTLSDSLVVNDSIVLDSSKEFDTDTVNLGEPLFTKIVSICVNEIDYFAEAYTLEDYTFRAVHTADSITDVRFTKIIQDTVDATDDFYGNANIDDDQYATFVKVLVDYNIASDTFDRIVNFNRSYLDSFNTSEQVSSIVNKKLVDIYSTAEVISKNISPAKADGVNSTDSARLNPGKRVNDIANTSEFKLFSVIKGIVDIATSGETVSKVVSAFYENASYTSDTFSRVFNAIRSFNEVVSKLDLVTLLTGKNALEIVSTSEFITRLVSKANNDTVHYTELKTFSVNKLLNDSVDATDDFYGAANVDDDQYALVAKTLADYSNTSDLFSRVVSYIRSYTDTILKSDIATHTFTKVLNDTSLTNEQVSKANSKILSDSSTTSQTVTIGVQSYFASNYVTPGYVGQTFTY